MNEDSFTEAFLAFQYGRNNKSPRRKKKNEMIFRVFSQGKPFLASADLKCFMEVMLELLRRAWRDLDDDISEPSKRKSKRKELQEALGIYTTLKSSLVEKLLHRRVLSCCLTRLLNRTETIQ